MIPLYENKMLVILEGVSGLERWRCSKEHRESEKYPRRKTIAENMHNTKGADSLEAKGEKVSMDLHIDCRIKLSLLKWAPGIERRHSSKLMNSVTWAAIKANSAAYRDHGQNFTKQNVFLRVKGSEQIGSLRFFCSTHLDTVHFIDFEHPRVCSFCCEHTHSCSCSQQTAGTKAFLIIHEFIWIEVCHSHLS